jgi:uncharacterized membrane protein SpoIIM required for sporulation
MECTTIDPRGAAVLIALALACVAGFGCGYMIRNTLHSETNDPFGRAVGAVFFGVVCIVASVAAMAMLWNIGR